MPIRKRDLDFKPTVNRLRGSLREAVGNQRTVGSAASVGSPHMLEERPTVNTFFHFFVIRGRLPCPKVIASTLDS